jgi:tetratricopeptide (TPR) repeat protein/DNA-binding MarR family transcriptional regulator
MACTSVFGELDGPVLFHRDALLVKRSWRKCGKATPFEPRQESDELMPRLLQPKAFTPSREDPAALDRRTVGRAPEIERLVESFKQAATSKTRQHTLLIGPRGAGKSHLVEVALHRLSEDCQLAESFCVARIPEDAVGIVSAADVLVAVLNSLPNVSSEQQNNARIARREKRLVDIESIVASAVGDHVLLLVIENLDRVFSALDESGQGDLRAWVEGSANVLILAASPQLFRGVISRQLPWFGSFRFEHLESLSVEEGTELIKRLATDAGDDALAAYLDTDRAHDRLKTIHHLAGGSPRIWTIFASSLSIESLEDLVPAVEDLFEQLVPYYQQRLWDLSPVEQKILNVLTLETATATVGEIAAISGLDAAVTTTTLRRLEDTNWVQSSKIAGTDQRTSWYEVREPLLRHHYQYRNNQRDELRLIVDLLRAWFSEGDRRKWFLEAPSSSLRESYLARTLSSVPEAFNSSYSDSSIEELQAAARMWVLGGGDGIGTALIGAVLDALVIGLLDSADAARASLATRRLPAGALDLLNAGLEAFSNKLINGAVVADSTLMGEALDRVAEADKAEEHPSLELLSACWNGDANPKRASERLIKLATNQRLGARLRLAVDVEAAYWLGESGRPCEAVELLGASLSQKPKASFDDLFVARTAYAWLLGESGRTEEETDLWEELVCDGTATLGAHDPDVLTLRHNYAHSLGESGQISKALELLEDLVSDQTSILGDTHRDSLSTRGFYASLLCGAGRDSEAIELYELLIDNLAEVLGPEHPDTFMSRHKYAFCVRESGQLPEAIELFGQLVLDQTAALGANHPDAFSARHNLAFLLYESGQSTEAMELLGRLIEDRTAVLGPNHQDVLASRHNYASWVGEFGEPMKAIGLFESLIDDRTTVLGGDHPDTLSSRRNYAYWLSESSRTAEAIEQLQKLLRDGLRGAGLGGMENADETPLDEGVFGEFLLLARLQVLRGLVKPTKVLSTAGLSVGELFGRIGFERDATAFAALPQEVRSLLETPL